MSVKRWWEDDYNLSKSYQIGANMYYITSSSAGQCKKFNCSQHTFNINFNNVNKTFSQAQNEIAQLFTDLHLKFLSGSVLTLAYSFVENTEITEITENPVKKMKVIRSLSLVFSFRLSKPDWLFFKT